MVHYFSSNFTLGILGGGQLGKMLLYETRKFDIKTSVLDPSKNAPCKIACDTFEVGDLMDFETVYNFGKKVDVLTFEIEHVNIDALEALEKEGITVYPSSNTLRNINDKITQKKFYQTHQIPTSSFQVFNSKDELIVAINKYEIRYPFVWKQSTGGYDGMGVCIVKNKEDLANVKNIPCIAEKLIPFVNELAVIVSRNPNGEVASYPVVEMEFHPEANQVEYVICPARIENNIAERAKKIAEKVSNAFEHVGLLAVELFQTEEGEILVNEVAPRPHNSGHFSIEGSLTNQFEQHIRAILNLPLGNTKSKIAAIMVNLVGEEGYIGDAYYKNLEQILSLEGVTPHIYGKKQTRPFRKMGHVTIVNNDISKARKIAELVKKTIKVINR
ncbi:5-(carboxyamino)imidazole ribonucleotide synthase [Flavobacteriaceae bacterium]|nr:5-(carboxyamino)imidazole ribonucleotide synthase [Flavobacteriaceae bacterium]MDB4590357.1 5-(carboxyamino)imidazole ribonucleotide synthase [Flavobacteriaceae bacterium]|tara:strand:- start:241 stop:1398 length:1158 start_codon:yes stop_codon:yes gene_type:complete